MSASTGQPEQLGPSYLLTSRNADPVLLFFLCVVQHFLLHFNGRVAVSAFFLFFFISAFLNVTCIEPFSSQSCQSQAYDTLVAIEAPRVWNTGKKPGNSSLFPGSPLFLAVAPFPPFQGGESEKQFFSHNTPAVPIPQPTGLQQSLQIKLGELGFQQVQGVTWLNPFLARRVLCHHQVIMSSLLFSKR